LATAEIPAHASVVVIGGGVMGCSTLYHLAKAGVSDAILLERNQLTSGTTWHSAAQVRALRSTRNLTELIRTSIALYKDLEAETGQATGWIGKGSLSIATTPDRMVHIERQAALARLFDVEAETVSKDEALERWPLMNAEDVIGAVWSPDDGRVSPSDLCAALVKGARTRGARIFENTGVTGILTRDGRIHGVETTRGTVRCDAIALCTGLWSRAAGAMAGVDVPVWPCEHFYLLTKPIDGITGNVPTLSDHDRHLYIRDDSGGLLVGCFEPLGKPIDPDRLGPDFAFQLLPEDWDHFEPMMLNALHRLPALETAEVKMLLNGPESFTPDGSFLLGETAETRGLFLGCGMNSVGVATGGGAGNALAHAILQGAPPMDLHEAEPNRFPDCFNSAEALAARTPEVLGKHYEIAYPGRQWASARHLRALPCHALWQAHEAHFGQVYGWERPLYFGKSGEPTMTFGQPDWHACVEAEVSAAHTAAALFDQSTFGKIDIKGPDAETFLSRLCTNRMDRAPGSVIYTLMLSEKGGILSDLTAIRIADEHYRLYVGTAAIRRDLGWLRCHQQPSEQITLSDVTEDYAVLGLMGPKANSIASILDGAAANDLGYFRAAECKVAGVPVLAARLSYVGEAGWEMTCRAADAPELAAEIVGAGATPAGLFAQTSMRIEKRFLAYGHDMDTDTNPFQAGLGFVLRKDGGFIGGDALPALPDAERANQIVTILLDDEGAVPIGNEPVLKNGQIIGKTTSAAFGFRVGKPIALADIDLDEAPPDGTEVEIDIAGERSTGHIHAGPAFDPSGARMRS
jgi:glycine cleavage system aminomethyltransferase T/glycine/D-amino acid oxidase-like deaminating enzyme